MIPSSKIIAQLPAGILHVCGDDPITSTSEGQEILVFSTYVEMILATQLTLQLKASILHIVIQIIKLQSILHVCGDDPSKSLLLSNFLAVFSTYVEMILDYTIEYNGKTSILHVCWDDPCTWIRCSNVVVYSPRMWRWSSLRIFSRVPLPVFSTYVEMILFYCKGCSIILSILHVCGDDPAFEDRINDFIKYSPRMWSCFWCPQVWRFCSALVLAKLLT